MSPLQENIQIAVSRISEYLTQHKTATSWQLKVVCRLSSSVLYLALGALYEQGKIVLEADGINYNITWGTVPAPQPPAAPIAQDM
ncbi:MAG: hypothetical protein E7027_03970 [Elusimicrobium sp.]|jgi:hypothetical protein|uniref:Uncharacterized protein n=1 Tax=Candidatus Avelusimicrobium gallicola TaxID=2562704 RepID=A0A928HG25_9BACT|nr:hypothetical protein [Elusimicrobium sp.]